MKINALAAAGLGIVIGAAGVTLLSRLETGRFPSQAEALSACNKWADPQLMVYVDHWKEWVPLSSCEADTGSRQILGMQPAGHQAGQTTNWPKLQRGQETPVVLERFRY